jgi:hypothetical protein
LGGRIWREFLKIRKLGQQLGWPVQNPSLKLSGAEIQVPGALLLDIE